MQKKINGSEQKVFDLIEMISFDHNLILIGIGAFNQKKRLTSFVLNNFLDLVIKHSKAEQELIQSSFGDSEEFYFHILEDQIEHGILYKEINKLKGNLRSKNSLDSEFFKVCNMLRQHIFEEEHYLLPILKKNVDQKSLLRLGKEYKSIRKVTKNHFLKSHRRENLNLIADYYFSDFDPFFQLSE